MHKTADSQTATVVVHSYPMLRLGIRSALEQEQLFRVVGESADPDEAFDLVDALQPAMVVLGMQFPGHTGFDVLRELRARFPALRILIYGDAPIADYPERCLRAGARGYVSMSDSVQSFVQAISVIRRGQIYLSEECSAALLSRLGQAPASWQRSAVERLSESELGVLTFISRGMCNRQIAAALHRSIKTVETYRSRIKRKVGVSNSTALAQFAMMNIHPSGRPPTALPSSSPLLPVS